MSSCSPGLGDRSRALQRTPEGEPPPQDLLILNQNPRPNPLTIDASASLLPGCYQREARERPVSNARRSEQGAEDSRRPRANRRARRKHGVHSRETRATLAESRRRRRELWAALLQWVGE